MSEKKPPKTCGGKREGAGRKPDWLKEKCRKLVDRKKLLEYVARVAAGEETERVVIRLPGNGGSDVEEVPCSTKDRLHAFELLMDRGFGKAIQAVEHSGSLVTSWKIVVEDPHG